jgi:hypothetical protein
MKKLKGLLELALIGQFPLILFTSIIARPLSGVETIIIFSTGLIYFILKEKNFFDLKKNDES